MICDRKKILEKGLLDKSSQTMSNRDKVVNNNQRQSEVPSNESGLLIAAKGSLKCTSSLDVDYTERTR